MYEIQVLSLNVETGEYKTFSLYDRFTTKRGAMLHLMRGGWTANKDNKDIDSGVCVAYLYNSDHTVLMNAYIEKVFDA